MVLSLVERYPMGEVRLVMTWNIQDGEEQPCVEFMVGEFGPGLLRLGLRISDAWYTQAGAGPQIILFGTLESADAARKLLATAAFQRLRDRLLAHVEDFHCRITRPNNGPFQQ